MIFTQIINYEPLAKWAGPGMPELKYILNKITAARSDIMIG